MFAQTLSSMKLLSLLLEGGPKFQTLKDNTVKLTDEEHEKVMDAKAVWHMGKDGAATPAIKKAEINGKTHYYSHTHRCFQSAKTLDEAIKLWREVVKPSS
jgi:hypothetical protein